MGRIDPGTRPHLTALAKELRAAADGLDSRESPRVAQAKVALFDALDSLNVALAFIPKQGYTPTPREVPPAPALDCVAPFAVRDDWEPFTDPEPTGPVRRKIPAGVRPMVMWR